MRNPAIDQISDHSERGQMFDAVSRSISVDQAFSVLRDHVRRTRGETTDVAPSVLGGSPTITDPVHRGHG